jgi:hypothetical protein
MEPAGVGFARGRCRNIVMAFPFWFVASAEATILFVRAFGRGDDPVYPGVGRGDDLVMKASAEATISFVRASAEATTAR